MPSHLLLRIAWQFNDIDPKNQAVINPCFRRQMDISDPTSGTDAQALCDDLAAAINTWTVPATKMITVKAYNLQGAKPNYPLASKTLGSTPSPTIGVPQQALCLSFYSGLNQPRKRGRLYLPAWTMTNTGAELSSSVASATLRTKAAALVPIFAGLGGANVDWIVWSRVAQSAGRVDNYFIDESWDIQRRRKVKSTQRTVGTTSG